jgi:hypothetical protein
MSKKHSRAKNEILQQIKQLSNSDINSQTGVFPERIYDVSEEAKKQLLNDKEIIHIDMLKFTLEVSKDIKDSIEKNENEKTKWRNIILTILSITFSCSVLAIGYILYLSFNQNFTVPTELIVGLSTTILIQLSSLMALFISFVTKVDYIEMYKEISKKLLDYLISNENTDANRKD